MANSIPIDVYLEEKEENRKLTKELCDLKVKYQRLVDRHDHIVDIVKIYFSQKPNIRIVSEEDISMSLKV